MIYRVEWGGKQKGRAASVVEAASPREARERAIERMAAAGLDWRTVARVVPLELDAAQRREA